jgi:hypothetical protein
MKNMTTDMGERERMEKIFLLVWKRRNSMDRARSFKHNRMGGSHVRECVKEAREANRQAVRLWWRR